MMPDATNKQLALLEKFAKYIPELQQDFSKLTRPEAQKLIQKYQLDIRIPKKPILNVFGRDFKSF